ncbi:MAG: SRPBCC family protein [Candidatus Heimdallarchaeota archaeon]|nr:SRPBCC family protein [Candidatus Heimdallarchaeota archaeon]
MIHQEILIDCSQEKCFKISQNYNIRLDWDPFLSEMVFLDGETVAAPKVQVRVKSKNNQEMTVEFITVKSPDHVSMKMTSGPIYFSKFSGTWNFQSIDDKQTKVVFRYKFRLKWWTIPIITRLFVNRLLSKTMKSRLIGLKKYCESID